MLYDVDYRTKPTADELEMYYGLRQVHSKKGFKRLTAVHPSRYPKSCRHYFSLFPNNLLDICELSEEKRLAEATDKFARLLNQNETGEQQILNFIKNEQAYFIVGSILKSQFSFGHHDAYLFREFQLGTLYQADFLLVGKSSGGFQFAFVEFETPDATAFRQDGGVGEGTNKGIRQIEDWDSFLDANFASLKQEFNKAKSEHELLPDEFISLDKSRIYYVVVSGRRDHYTDLTYTKRRKMELERKIWLLHYDNLVDSCYEVIGQCTY